MKQFEIPFRDWLGQARESLDSKGQPVSEYLFRITFTSGKVFEEIGVESSAIELFDLDAHGLVDYILGIELTTGEEFVWTREEDTRFDDYRSLTVRALLDAQDELLS